MTSLIYEEMLESLKKLAGNYPMPVWTSQQLPRPRDYIPMGLDDTKPRPYVIDYVSIIAPKWSPATYFQKKSRFRRPNLSAAQLRDAEQTWVPGYVLVVENESELSSGETIAEVREWIKDCCAGRVVETFTCQKGRIETFRFTFDSEVDKVMFKMRWPCR